MARHLHLLANMHIGRLPRTVATVLLAAACTVPAAEEPKVAAQSLFVETIFEGLGIAPIPLSQPFPPFRSSPEEVRNFITKVFPISGGKLHEGAVPLWDMRYFQTNYGTIFWTTFEFAVQGEWRDKLYQASYHLDFPKLRGAAERDTPVFRKLVGSLGEPHAVRPFYSTAAEKRVREMNEYTWHLPDADVAYRCGINDQDGTNFVVVVLTAPGYVPIEPFLPEVARR